MGLEPRSLDSSGGTTRASISTQDNSSPTVEGVTFTISGPDGTAEPLIAISCGVETTGERVSRCWETSFNVEANPTEALVEYRVEAFSSDIDGVRSDSVTVSQYPRWGQAQVELAPVSLPSGGGTASARISTQDAGEPPVEGLTFKITRPDGTAESLGATSCGVEEREYFSRCWEASFNVEANLSGGPDEYRIEASSPNIVGVRAGSVTISQYPRWGHVRVEFAPAILPSGGGITTASISTRDIGTSPGQGLTFTLSRPDGTAESLGASGCGVENRGEHISRCWDTTFNVEANPSGAPNEYKVEVSSPDIVGVRAGSVTVSQYPGWGQDQVEFAPAILPSGGGTTTASISTRDKGTTQVEGLNFTITRSDGTAESVAATSCGARATGEHVSRCWQTSVNVEANPSGRPQEYEVEVSSSDMVGVRAGSVTVLQYPPGWGHAQVQFAPASFPARGGTTTASISTQDNGEPQVEGVTLTITGPDGTIESVAGTSCGVENRRGHISRCWGTSFSVEPNPSEEPNEYKVEASSSDIGFVRAGSVTVSPYPRWGQAQVEFASANLPSGGHAVKATISTQDNGEPPIEGLAFAIRRPDGTGLSLGAANCGAEARGEHVSRCWETSFNVEASESPGEYRVSASSRVIDRARSATLEIRQLDNRADATIDSSLPNENRGSANKIAVGNGLAEGNPTEWQILMRWGNLPPMGDIIGYASLSLHVADHQMESEDAWQVNVALVPRSPLRERLITWAGRPTAAPPASFHILRGPQVDTFVSLDLTAVVQQAVDNGFGELTIMASVERLTGDTGIDSVTFSSKESSDPASRPSLLVASLTSD